MCGISKASKVVSWSPPGKRVLKFNMDGAAKRKSDQRVFRVCFVTMMGMFSKQCRFEVEVLTILEALQIFVSSVFQSKVGSEK